MYLIVMALAHYISDGKHISFPLMYYIDSLLVRTWVVRWLTILLWQFCFALDHYCSSSNGRLHFPFALELYTLFFKRFESTRLALILNLPLRNRTDAFMHMWGKLFPKRGQSEWLCSAFDKDVCELLTLEDDHDVLDILL